MSSNVSQNPQMSIPNDIDLVDKGVLSSFFNAGGYVLDFSTEKFNQFTTQSVGVALCLYYGLSKGKSLESFTAYGDVVKVVKLYDDLIRYYEANYADQLLSNVGVAEQVKNLKVILDKYRGATVSVMTPALKRVSYAYIRKMSERAQKDVESGELDSAITKARTLLEEAFCYVIERKGGVPDASGEIRKKYDQVKTLYHMKQGADVDHRINGLLSGLEKIVTAITEMRNGASDSHGVGSRRISVRSYHARLLVNSAQTMADFILAVSEAVK